MEQNIGRKNLAPLNEGQAIEAPAEVVETPEQPEKIDDLEFQARMLRERWEKFAGAIIKKDYQSGQLEDDLSWFAEKSQETRKDNNGLGAGGWTHMALELALDEKFSQAIDEYQKAEILEPAFQEHGDEEREAIIADIIKKDKRSRDDLPKQDKIKARVLFLENLLNQTTKRFTPHHEGKEDQDKNQKEVLVSLWSVVFSRFIEMRAQASQGRLKEILPEINKIKGKTVDYLKEHYPDLISPEGLARVKDIQIWFGDEFLESGAGWANQGAYSADKVPPRLRISGLTSLDEEKLRRILIHELLHAASGHGIPGQPRRGQEEADQHIMAKRRIGLSDNKQNNWLNEAITEKLCGRVNDISEGELNYPLERSILSILLENKSIKEEDLMSWYFTEGDDGAKKERLQALYPDFFPKLAIIQKMSKGGKSLERLNKEDMAEFVKAIF